MIKTDITKLDNGLLLLLCEDKTKHSTYAELVTNFGGLTKDFKVGGETYHLVDGIAHLLEHTLIDAAPSGNLLKLYNDNYVSFNGTTSRMVTSFFIDTVEDFEKHLRTLLTNINNARFTNEDVEESKLAVFEEIKKNNDRPYRKYNRMYIENLLENTDYIDNIGNMEKVKGVTYDLLRLCYKTFYQPSNQVLLISGNFDIDDAKKLVSDIYDELDITPQEFELIPLNESPTFSVKEQAVSDTKDDDLYNITYKIDISNLEPKYALKLAYYVHYFLRHNFGDSSPLFEDLLKNKYSYFSIETAIFKLYDYLYIDIGCYTKNHEYFLNRVKDIIENRGIIDEEKFDLLKKREIVNQILKEESCGKMLKSIYGNIVDHNLYEPDTLEDVESLNIKEYKEYLEKLDFSNYMITIHNKIENNDEENG